MMKEIVVPDRHYGWPFAKAQRRAGKHQARVVSMRLDDIGTSISQELPETNDESKRAAGPKNMKRHPGTAQ